MNHHKISSEAMGQYSNPAGQAVSSHFDARAFRSALLRYLLLFSSPLILFGVVSVFLPKEVFPGWNSASGIGWFSGLGQDGIAMGPVAVGGVVVGLIAFGGQAFGLIAVGGCAVGLVAIGGGAVGVVAVGGGAAGYIALGGAAIGKYALAGGGKGMFVLTYCRQDRRAAEFFCRWLKRLRKAFPNGVEALES